MRHPHDRVSPVLAGAAELGTTKPRPRRHGRAAGAYAAPPEYWLPQLAQRKRVVARNSTGKRWIAGQLPLWLPNETVVCHDRHWNCALASKPRIILREWLSGHGRVAEGHRQIAEAVRR